MLVSVRVGVFPCVCACLSLHYFFFFCISVYFSVFVSGSFNAFESTSALFAKQNKNSSYLLITNNKEQKEQKGQKGRQKNIWTVHRIPLIQNKNFKIQQITGNLKKKIRKSEQTLTFKAYIT